MSMILGLECEPFSSGAGSYYAKMLEYKGTYCEDGLWEGAATFIVKNSNSVKGQAKPCSLLNPQLILQFS